MTERERIIERLRAVDLGGGSHESLSAIAKAIYEPAGGWTIGACERLRQTLVRLLEEAEDVDQGARIIASDEGWDEGYKAGYDAGFASADDWLSQHEDAMAEHGWIRLPKDADGEVWHIGDEIQAPDNCHETVKGFRVYELDGEQRWEVIANGYLWGALTHRHYCQPTVEDVLRELIGKALTVIEIGGEDKLVAEFAAKLRLAEESAS